MKRLFMTFSHEFGTSLNCIASLSQSGVESKIEIMKYAIKKYLLPIFKSS